MDISNSTKPSGLNSPQHAEYAGGCRVPNRPKCFVGATLVANRRVSKFLRRQAHSYGRRVLAVAMVMTLSACSFIGGRATTGAPVEDIGSRSSGDEAPAVAHSRVEEPRVQVYPMEPQELPVLDSPLEYRDSGSVNPAVAGLLQQATRQVEQEQLVQAVATLERALRIEPRSAHVWNLLAQVRLRQKQFTLAESMALKSNMLAQQDTGLQERNWRLIASSRIASGDREGARKAQQQAAQLAEKVVR